MYHPHEWGQVEDAAKRRGITPARYQREAALAVADGRVLPAMWFQRSLEMLDEVQGMIAGVKDFMPDGWNQDAEAMLEDAVFALNEEAEGFDPEETSG